MSNAITSGIWTPEPENGHQKTENGTQKLENGAWAQYPVVKGPKRANPSP